MNEDNMEANGNSHPGRSNKNKAYWKESTTCLSLRKDRKFFLILATAMIPHRSPTDHRGRRIRDRCIFSSDLSDASQIHLQRPFQAMPFPVTPFYSRLSIASPHATLTMDQGESMPHRHTIATWYIPLKNAPIVLAPLHLILWFSAHFARSAPRPPYITLFSKKLRLA